MTPEQESELVAAIKEAFDSDKWFDEASILGRANGGESPRLTAAIESIVGPKTRYRSGWRRGWFKPRPCKAAILAVRKHFETDEAGWWRGGTRRALKDTEPSAATSTSIP
jgi:hypothetical protein